MWKESKTMTVQQIENEKFEVKMFIADKFRDIQMQSNSLKNVEDTSKVHQTLTKIVDFVEEVRRSYSRLETLDMEEPEEENNDEFNAFGGFM